MKLLQKGTQITWTVDDLLKEGFIKVGSKTYEEYWKHTKTDSILTLSVVDDNFENFLLINTVGGYDSAYKIIKNQPKGSTRYNPKCYKMGYLKIQKRKLYASDGVSRFVLWDVWGNIAYDWEEAISLNALRKEVINYATEHNISNGMRLKD